MSCTFLTGLSQEFVTVQAAWPVGSTKSCVPEHLNANLPIEVYVHHDILAKKKDNGIQQYRALALSEKGFGVFTYCVGAVEGNLFRNSSNFPTPKPETPKPLNP